MRTGKQGNGGFAYVMLLIAVAVIGITASSAISLGASIARRDAERHLLAIGAEFEQALRSYAGVSPGAAVPVGARGPRTLEELLKDSRSAGLRRHLRQIYTDPLTGTQEWGVVVDSQGFITGVYSLAEGTPIQRAGFEMQRAHFNDAESYQKWVFGL